ncbi:protein NPGR2-like isoform X2 [Ipomoea triloba]|nr:protein NPGR2-like isoform X2 [Ipomoea triloba]XP_031114362.1 protein NPGR2-like isoform X2 [Ipomoea triloba]
MSIKYWIYKWKVSSRLRLQKMMKCICSGEQFRLDEIIPSSESLATRDYSASASASGFSSRAAGEADTKADASNIEEAESSLRESGFLNYEEARALLGRLEYQKGNLEAALHVFEGIDIAAVIPKIKISLARRSDPPRRNSQSDATLPMSMHAVSLLFEAMLLKTKSLQALGRFTEAAQTCKIILDTVESTLPDSLPENVATDCKLLDTLNKAVELLPELWKHAFAPQEVILAYRRALLYNWNLDVEIRSKIEMEFAEFLLYSGTDAIAPNLRSQSEGSFIPMNNIEEAVLLLLVLLKRSILKPTGHEPSILDHLYFALSIAGELRELACHVEELPPGIVGGKQKFTTLSLCYYAEGDNAVSLNLLRNLLNNRENENCILELLFAAKICKEDTNCLAEGIQYARKALPKLEGKCDQMASVASCLLGLSLSAQSRIVASDSQRTSRQSEALEALETAQNLTRGRDPNVLFYLSLENAEQRKLDAALYYAKELLRLEAGSSIKGWILLARILSAQKSYVDAENIINAALDETGKWDQGKLLRTKAKLQIARGNLKGAIETYTHILAVLQVKRKSFRAQKKLTQKMSNTDRSLEVETWHDLANVYTNLSQWRDAELCLSKSEAIAPHSASRLHCTGLLYQSRGLNKEALRLFGNALDIEPDYVPSLVSTAIVLKQLGCQSMPVVKSFLTEALRLDRTNTSAWYNLGLFYKDENGASALEAAECFEAATLLQESAPVEPFR